MHRLLGVLAVMGCIVLSGCTATAPAPAPSSAAPTPTATPVDPDAPILARARLDSAQDDDSAALALLQPLTSSAATELTATVQQHQADLVTWPHDSTISHLFFHSLIVDPKRAFDGDADAAGYDDYMVTESEFRAVLRSLYSRGFVLVSPHDFARFDGHRMHYLPLRLPRGRTPIVLSQDDVNYYRYEQGDGLASNLTLEDGRVVSTYRDRDGHVLHGAYDVAPVVDDFVREHPDFAYHGHKGILALTGYEGVLGYRTSASEDGRNPHIVSDRAQAKRVADALKAEGWEFASHSWGHIDDTTASLGWLQRDSARWDAEVRPITGPTDLYVYPFGADISGVAPYSGPKLQILERHGFHLFFGVDGSTPHWQQLGATYLRQERIDVDGIRLRGALHHGETVLDGFFDPRAVYDRARPQH
jgi:hypothetical protein